MEKYDLAFYQQSADAILAKIKERPRYALVLGSSLGPLADEVEDRLEIPYADVPNLLRSTAPGHAGKFIFGRLAGKPVVMMSGRFHYYEGYSYESLAQPVRILKLLGVETLILTNAAGCVNLDWKKGDIMLITDHLNMIGASPMRGPNLACFGERFFDCSEIYSKDLQEHCRRAVAELDLQHCFREGVYFLMPGPHYETPAEIRAVRILGGDAVGMSTITEALTASHCQMKVLGLSLLTNMAAGTTSAKLSEAEVAEGAAEAVHNLQALLKLLLGKLD